MGESISVARGFVLYKSPSIEEVYQAYKSVKHKSGSLRTPKSLSMFLVHSEVVVDE